MSQDLFVVVEHLQGEVAPITYVMLAAAHNLADRLSGQVVGVLLGHHTEGLAADLAADRVLYVDHPALAEFTSDAYGRTLRELIRSGQPRAVFLGSTSIGSDIASTLSASLGLPLVSSCLGISQEGTLTCQICGGKIMAEVVLPPTTTLITMIPGGYQPEEGRSQTSPEIFLLETPELEELRVSLYRYVEPEMSDVDISKADVLVAVGRGIQMQDNIALVEELAGTLGGAVCASRPVVDQGWLPISRLVGKSGKTVRPKVYLALGISGAPEHTESIGESDTIIAINTDPSAPIFDLARYGAEIDMFDLIEILTEKVEAAKSA